MTKQYELIQTMSAAPMPTPTYDYDAHPLAATFPMIEGTAFEELKADIRNHGILEPIKLYLGMILDGRNRYAAAKAVGHQSRLRTSRNGMALSLKQRLGSSQQTSKDANSPLLKSKKSSRRRSVRTRTLATERSLGSVEYRTRLSVLHENV